MSSPSFAIGGLTVSAPTDAIDRGSERPKTLGLGAQMASGSKPRVIVVEAEASWLSRNAAIASLVAVVVTSGLGLLAWHRVTTAEASLTSRLAATESALITVRASAKFQDRRTRMLDGIRDEIASVNRNLSQEEATEFAALLIRASEKYPSVDPLLFLSVGIVESRFKPQATSHVNARGLYQIWPPTGKRLAENLGWTYDDEILYDPVRNTELAAFYLDILFAAYNDERMVLAEYNGGPLNAGYYRAGSPKIAAETKDYVAKVSREYARLQAAFRRLPADSETVLRLPDDVADGDRSVDDD